MHFIQLYNDLAGNSVCQVVKDLEMIIDSFFAIAGFQKQI